MTNKFYEFVGEAMKIINFWMLFIINRFLYLSLVIKEAKYKNTLIRL